MAPTALLRMILQQGDALDRMAGLDLAEPAGVLAGAARIILVGTGTSQHAAELGAMMLAVAGRDARWYPAATWARWGTGPRPGDALLVISHTGETAYAARARADALAAGVPVVSITGTGRAWPEAIETVAPDESHTYTVSYTAALAVLARLAHELGSPDGSPGQVAQAATAVRHVCAEPGIDEVAVPARSLAIVGPGPWGITAREGALKIREGARMLAEGFDTDRLLHGGAVPLTARGRAGGAGAGGGPRRPHRRARRRCRGGAGAGRRAGGRGRAGRHGLRPAPAAGADPDDGAAAAAGRAFCPPAPPGPGRGHHRRMGRARAMEDGRARGGPLTGPAPGWRRG